MQHIESVTASSVRCIKRTEDAVNHFRVLAHQSQT
jgi:hypothetical protein